MVPPGGACGSPHGLGDALILTAHLASHIHLGSGAVALHIDFARDDDYAGRVQGFCGTDVGIGRRSNGSPLAAYTVSGGNGTATPAALNKEFFVKIEHSSGVSRRIGGCEAASTG
jgi:hypothetical protein